MSWQKISITPMGAPRMTQRDRWAKRPVVERYFAYRDELRLIVNRQFGGPDRLVHDGRIGLIFALPIPRSRYKQRKGYPALLPSAPHEQKPDLDNLVKGFKDALFTEDSHIHEYAPEMKKIWHTYGYILVWLND